MYKLIAIDLDGTLLNSYGEISKKNARAIKKAEEKGIKVVLTSGRTSSSIESYANDMGANEFLISGNGASVYDLQKKEIIYNNFLSKEKVLELCDICEKNSMFYNVYTENSVITKSLNYNTLFYHSENLKKPEDKQTKLIIVENILQYIQKLQNKIFLKITVCDKDKQVFDNIISTLKQYDDINVLETAHMSRKILKFNNEEKPIEYYYTEITNKNVDKWEAIKFLINKLKIKKEDVVAIGDNINDYEMIKNAGLRNCNGKWMAKLKRYCKFCYRF